MNVPPSPATQFLMSPQVNPRTTAYFAQTQMPPHLPQTSSHVSVQQQASPDPPTSDHKLNTSTNVPSPAFSVNELPYQAEGKHSPSYLSDNIDNES